MEPAGLVLATFPVIIRSLSSCREGLEIAKLWRRYRRQLGLYESRLESERIFYFDTLEELLESIARSDEELLDLVHDPGGLSWKKPEHQQQLEARLDRSYNVFVEKIKSLLTALENIADKLGTDSSGKVRLLVALPPLPLVPVSYQEQINWDHLPSTERVIKRLKLVLTKSACDEIFAQLRTANIDLRELTHQTRFLEPIRRKRHSRQQSLNYRRIQSQARSLHNALAEDTFWNCSCRNQHVALLRLEPRPRHRREAAGFDTGSGTRFRVCLRNKARFSWEWQQADIEPVEASNTRQSIQNSNTSGSTSQPGFLANPSKYVSF